LTAPSQFRTIKAPSGDNDMRTNDYDMQSPFEIDAETFAEMMAQLQANSEEVEDADYADCPW